MSDKITYHAIRERIESSAKEIIEEHCNFPTVKEKQLFADSALGVYIPQHFAESVNREMCDAPDSDLDELLKGPETEYYWDIWQDVLDRTMLMDSDGNQWRLEQDGDLWLVPADHYEQWESYQSELESLSDESYEKALEEIDSWDWVIYTYQGFLVYDALSSSERYEAEQAFEDCGGYEQAAEQHMGLYEIGCAMAYHWLSQELAREIQSQCEELIDLCQNQLDNM